MNPHIAQEAEKLRQDIITNLTEALRIANSMDGAAGSPDIVSQSDYLLRVTQIINAKATSLQLKMHGVPEPKRG